MRYRSKLAKKHTRGRNVHREEKTGRAQNGICIQFNSKVVVAYHLHCQSGICILQNEICLHAHVNVKELPRAEYMISVKELFIIRLNS